MMETTSVWEPWFWRFLYHSLYPCKAVPSNIFSDITWTKLAGNIPLTPRKTPAHQSLSTWQNVFKYFFRVWFGDPKSVNAFYFDTFLILWGFHSLIHQPIWFDLKKLERFIQNKVYWDFFFVSKCMEDYEWCVWHVYKIHVLL